ncbi:MAG TPA: Ig-like domain-containing protein, partial [Caldilineaceae bacterium]|nr:Ig-like domain-containing protein [Caldilineaceae bacterium]
PSMQYPCAIMHDRLLDCNHDDYFHTNPPADSYLATNWNVANSAFLFIPNQPPSIAIATSGNITRYKRPASITVTATATDEDGQIVRVVFFKNATMLATFTAPPYEVTFTEAQSGNVTISAIAYDDDEAAGYSAPLTLVLEDPVDKPPTATPMPTAHTPTATMTPTPPTATPWPTPTNPPAANTPVPTSPPALSPNEAMTLTHTTTNGRKLTAHIPAGAITEPVLLVFAELTTPTQPTAGQFQFAGFGFTLRAYQNEQAVVDFAFSQPVTLSLTYAESDVAAVDENQLTLFFYDVTTQQWSQAGITVLQRDQANHQLTVQITRLGEFALGTANRPLYLPLINRQH